MQIEVVAKIKFWPAAKLWDRPAGFYWWFSATAPDGHEIVGCGKGPFDSRYAATADVVTSYPDVKTVDIGND